MPKSRTGFAQGHVKANEPSGYQWSLIRKRLWRMWTQNGAHQATCYACEHPISPGLGEVQHLLPPSTHPGLRMTESNLRPIHGGGRKRCGVCGLACNSVSASNLAVRDASGRALPFTDAFIRQAQERTADPRSRSGRIRPPAAPGRDTASIPKPAAFSTKGTDEPHPLPPVRRKATAADWL